MGRDSTQAIGAVICRRDAPGDGHGEARRRRQSSFALRGWRSALSCVWLYQPPSALVDLCRAAADAGSLDARLSRRSAGRRARLQRRSQLGAGRRLFLFAWYFWSDNPFLLTPPDPRRAYRSRPRSRLWPEAPARASRTPISAGSGKRLESRSTLRAMSPSRSASAAARKSAKRRARGARASASSPHFSMFQSSSTWAARQAGSTSSAPLASASAISAEPVSAVARLRPASRNGSSKPSIAAASAASVGAGCATCTTPRRARSARRSAARPMRGSGPRLRAAARPVPPARRRGSREDRCRHSQ